MLRARYRCIGASSCTYVSSCLHAWSQNWKRPFAPGGGASTMPTCGSARGSCFCCCCGGGLGSGGSVVRFTNRPFIRGRFSALTLRTSYRIFLANSRVRRFSLYRDTRASRSPPVTAVTAPPRSPRLPACTRFIWQKETDQLFIPRQRMGVEEMCRSRPISEPCRYCSAYREVRP